MNFGTDPAALISDALLQSIDKASGDCQANIPAAAWFWFVLETTIGHGNQSVQTQGGRTMVYTLGFCCILAFAAVLGTSGRIIVTILETTLFRRWKLKTVRRLRISLILWGSLYYVWMGLIASVVRAWKKRRIGLNDFSLRDGYWFAFISTTTVGLGDYYLEPSVIRWQDMITFPMLFLIGFVFLAAFLTTMAEMLISFVPLKMRKDHLMERLKTAGMMREEVGNICGDDENGAFAGDENRDHSTRSLKSHGEQNEHP